MWGRKVAFSALALAGIAFAGCGSSSTTVVERTTTIREARETTSAAVTTEPNTKPSASDRTAPTYGYLPFRSPSGNLLCAVATNFAGCQAAEYSYAPPAKPADCHLDWGREIRVGKSDPASFSCYGGMIAEPDSPVLHYGYEVSRGAYSCRSSERGMTCLDSRTRHGFFISRDSYRLF
jgi:hypothetical protein